MIKTERPSFSFSINSRPVIRFKGQKTYVSTGDSDDMDNGELVTYSNRPSRANVQPKIGDVIFAKMANTSKTFLVDDRLSKMIFSTGFFDISSDKFDNRFLYYLIQSDEFDGYKNAYSEGTTQVSISDKRLKKILVSFEKDKNRQKIISEFLDYKIWNIDKLIRDLQEQIQCLRDYFFEKIDNEIFYSNGFKTFNDHACLTRPLKQLFTLQKGLNITKDDLCESGVPVISYGQTHNDFYKYEFNTVEQPVPFISKSFLRQRSCKLKYGDFVFADTSEDIKGSADFSMLNRNDLCMAGYHSIIVRNKAALNHRFFMYQFMSNVWKDQIKCRVDGVKVYSLTQTILGNVRVWRPNANFQAEVVSKLDDINKKIKRLIEIKKEQVALLKRLKKSLIYEYVSGKKEVVE